MNEKVTWSSYDQKELDDLLERKKRFDEQCRAPLESIIETTLLRCIGLVTRDAQSIDETVNRMILFAGPLRDALAPYDSRLQAPSPTPPPSRIRNERDEA